MKKIILLATLLIIHLTSFASPPRNSYITVGYIKSELNKQGENNSLKSRYGLSISTGYTHFLNKEPILGSLYLGLDWTFLYGSLRQYKIHLEDYIDKSKISGHWYPKDLKKDFGIDHSSIGMQFGPSITSVPAEDLQISAYFRYAPTLGFIESAVDPYNPPNDIHMESYLEEVDFSYVGYYSVGLSASYKIYMAGIEYKWATMTHNVKTSEGAQTIKLDTKGVWLNIGVRLGKKY